MNAPRILDVGCGRGKFPGAIGIDISTATQADVVCDWTRGFPFTDSVFDQIRMIHIIEEVPDIMAALAEAHRVARPGGRLIIVTPHYTDHSSYCSPTHRWHLSSFSFWFFSDRPLEYDYYAPARFREVRVTVKLLQLWRWLGLEFLVNHSLRFRRFWEYYLCFLVRGKVIEFELEKPAG